MIKKILTGIIALVVMTPIGFTASCYDREIETEVEVDRDNDLDGRTDTTIKREIKID